MVLENVARDVVTLDRMVRVCVCVLSHFSCILLFATLWTIASSSVHGILQARILEWVAVSSSRGSSHHRDRTWVSCTAGRFFTTGEAPWLRYLSLLCNIFQGEKDTRVCIQKNFCIHISLGFTNSTTKILHYKLMAFSSFDFSNFSVFNSCEV